MPERLSRSLPPAPAPGRRVMLAGLAAALAAVPRGPAAGAEPAPPEAATTGAATAAAAGPGGEAAAEALRRTVRQVAEALHPAGGASHVVSPASVSAVLVLLGAAQAGPAAERLPPGLLALAGAQPDSLRGLLAPAGEEALKVATAIWRAEDLVPKPGFEARAEALGLPVRAAAQGGLADAVNAWVEQRTAGMIERLLDAGAADARLVAANATAFRGRWRTAFDPAGTRPARFRAAGGATPEVPMMAARLDAVPALDEGGLRGVLLPYEGGRFGLLALRRAEPATTPPPLAALLDLLAGGPPALGERSVELRLPRFEAEGGGNLAGPLAAAGYGGVIGTPLAALAEEPVTIRDVVHRARIRVDEAGTIAAAATAAVGIRSLVPRPLEVTFDQPFLYAVLDRESGLPWFLGVMAGPA